MAEQGAWAFWAWHAVSSRQAYVASLTESRAFPLDVILLDEETMQAAAPDAIELAREHAPNASIIVLSKDAA